MPPTNSAAWLTAKRVKPVKIGPAPYTPPGAGQIVVKNGAIAINPADWLKQEAGNALLGYIRYPFILGIDVAGEVVEIGEDVKRFSVGDRVLAHAAGGDRQSNNPAEGAFQHYTVIREYFAAAIPAGMSYSQACVLPLGLSTAAYGLFHHNFLHLDAPTAPAPAPTSSSKAIIITAGASSVGSCAVQLAVSAGYQVYSTASPKNFPYVKKLGATQVFDYHNASLVDEMAAALKGKTVAGAYSIGNGALETCQAVLRLCSNDSNRFIALAGIPILPKQLEKRAATAALFMSMGWLLGKTAVTSSLTGVKVKFIDFKEFCQVDNVISRTVYLDFLPRALASGQVIPAPEPVVVGRGLDKIQEAMNVQQKGVSAQKIVVEL